MAHEQSLLRAELARALDEVASPPFRAQSMSQLLSALASGPIYGVMLSWNSMELELDRVALAEDRLQIDIVYPQPRVPGSHDLWRELLRRLIGDAVPLHPERVWSVNGSARSPAPLLKQTNVRQPRPQDRSVDRAWAEIAGNAPPAVLKWACKRCPFRTDCFDPADAAPVLDLPKLNRSLFEELRSDGIHRIADLDPADARLGRSQRRAIDAEASGCLVMDRDAVVARLDSLEWPLTFLDFEASTGLVPLLPGAAPFGQVPFQYSLQVQESPGAALRSRGYLAPDRGDWRPALARHLVRDLPRSGSIIAWGAAFEDKCLREISGWESGAESLAGARSRLFDLHPLVRDLVSHPRMRGRSGLKAVLPALTAGNGYAELEIADGRSAASAFALLRHRQSGRSPGKTPGYLERRAVRKRLMSYCELDTLALSDILTALRTTSYPPS